MAELFVRHVRQESQHLVKPSGMSREGTILNFMKLPPGIYPAVKHLARKHLGIDDFWRDPENYRAFCRVWQDAHVKKKPTSYLKVPSLK